MENWAFDTFSFISGLIGGGVIGSLVSLTISKRMTSKGHGTTVDQSKVKAGGDVIGRDKKG